MTLDVAPFRAACAAYFGQNFKIELDAGMTRLSRTFMRAMISRTPPNSGPGRDGADGPRTGKAKIYRQMLAILAPKKLKGRRQITTVFGRTPSRAVYTPTVEKYPDVAGLYRANSRMLTNRLGYRVNYTGQKFFVDKTKFTDLLRYKQFNVGTLMGGWGRAISLLKLPFQRGYNYARGYGRGDAVQVKSATEWSLTVSNHGVPDEDNVYADMQRHLQYAVYEARNTVLRQVKATTARRAVAFSTGGSPLPEVQSGLAN